MKLTIQELAKNIRIINGSRLMIGDLSDEHGVSLLTYSNNELQAKYDEVIDSLKESDYDVISVKTLNLMKALKGSLDVVHEYKALEDTNFEFKLVHIDDVNYGDTIWHERMLVTATTRRGFMGTTIRGDSYIGGLRKVLVVCR